jgi:hypothetical protein
MFGARHPATANRKQCHCCVALWLFTLAGLLLAPPSLLADEQTLLSYDNPFPRPNSMTLWDTPRLVSTVAVEITLDLHALSEIWKGEFDFTSFFRHATPGEGPSSSKATLLAGVGQYFPDPPLALATSGAGFEDLHWIYVKLSLTF